MTASDDLFQLIRSLTKNEKGYFKKHSSFHSIGGHNKYLLLFDAIEKQKAYDEQAIRKKFSKEKFIRQLHVAKNYLYNLILSSLEQYRNDVDSQLKSYLSQAAFLFDKQLYDQCRKLVQKARELAEKYEKYPELYMLMDFEFKLLFPRSYAGVTEEYIAGFFKQKNAVLDKLKNSDEFVRISSLLDSKLMQQGPPRTKKELTIYEDVMKDAILDTADNAISFKAKYYYYSIFSVYAALTNDAEANYLNTGKAVLLQENNPHRIAENPSHYMRILVNHSISQLKIGKIKDVLNTIRKLKEIPARSESLKKRIAFVAVTLELDMYAASGDFQKGAKLIEQVRQKDLFKGINKFEMSIIYHHATNMNFGYGNYQRALNYLHKILDEKNTDVRGDLYCYAKLLMIIIYFEMGKESLLESAIRSTYRYLYKRDKLYKAENYILRFIRKLPVINTSKELIGAFKELKGKFEEFSRDPYESNALRYFDYIDWLESKISKREFSDVVKKRSEDLDRNS